MTVRMRIRALTLVLATGVLATACTSEPAPAPPPSSAPSVSTSESTPSPTSAPAVTVKGAPEGLAALVRAKYAGRSGVVAKAAVGTWKGDQVAVVTAGKDVTLAVAAPRWKVVGGWWPSLGSPEPQVGGRDFVLAIGSDAREEDGQRVDRSRADAIQLVGRDGQGGGGVLGIPRDLWVTMASGSKAKINAALVFDGPEGMTRTVARVTGVPVKGYVLMGFRGVRDSVDALGGLPIISDLSLPKAEIRRGPQVLTGRQVLWYARERMSLPDGDFGRSRHQGQLILAAAVQGRLKGALWAPEVVSVLDEHTISNLSAEQVIQWVGSFYALDPSRVGRQVASGAVGTAGGQSVVLLTDRTRAQFKDLRDGNLAR